jgi:hypothetical protein
MKMQEKRGFVSPKHLLPFTGPHSIIPKNTELFIGTAVRSSNPTHSDDL